MSNFQLYNKQTRKVLGNFHLYQKTRKGLCNFHLYHKQEMDWAIFTYIINKKGVGQFSSI